MVFETKKVSKLSLFKAHERGRALTSNCFKGEKCLFNRDTGHSFLATIHRLSLATARSSFACETSSIARFAQATSACLSIGIKFLLYVWA